MALRTFLGLAQAGAHGQRWAASWAGRTGQGWEAGQGLWGAGLRLGQGWGTRLETGLGGRAMVKAGKQGRAGG